MCIGSLIWKQKVGYLKSPPTPPFLHEKGRVAGGASLCSFRLGSRYNLAPTSAVISDTAGLFYGVDQES